LNINVELSQLLARVHDSHGKTVDAEINEKSAHTYEIKYVPHDAGTHKLEILVKGEVKQTVTIHVDPAPYLRLLGTQHVTNAIVGQQVEFKIEYPVGTVTVGQIVASFKDIHQNVVGRTHVVGLGEGKFAVRYTPEKAGKFTTKVAIQGAGTMDGQLEIDAQLPPGITLIEGASGLATVGKPFTFKLAAPSIKLSQIDVSVTSPSGKHDSALVSESGEGIFSIVYTPSTIGKYTAEIKLDGGLVSKPLIIDSRSDVKWVSHIPVAKGELLVGKEFEFVIELSESANNTLTVSITDADHTQIFHGKLQHNHGHQYGLKWKPPTGGHYGCQVELDGKPLGEPVVVYATEPKGDTGGKNTSKGKLGNTFNVSLKLEDMEHKKIEARVKDQDGNFAGAAQIVAEGGGKYKISYKPEKEGLHTCSLVIDGVAIAGSDLYFDVHS